MIQFDFIVSEEEANTIFGCISEEIERMFSALIESDNVSNKKWYHGRIEYLNKLKAKMKNRSVR
jgi:hypothetical protein